MSWFSVLHEPEQVDVHFKEPIFAHTERFCVLSNELSEMSLIGQFFIATCVLVDGRAPIQVPLFSARERETLLHDVASHVTDCKIMHFQNDDRTVAILTGVKPDSQTLFLRQLEEGKLHPLVADLYREESSHQDSSMTGVPVLYEINRDSLGVSDPDGFREMWNFISNTFVKAESHITVMPRGWEFGEHVTES
ncbi:hypothetical protein, partial [Tumebacillus permanentifrigoris]